MTTSFDVNRVNWDDRAAIHLADKAGSYRVAEFLAGGDTLHDIEHDEIGDVRGLRIAHLQCHFGLDTLSLARRGASCVGLDFSPVAIAGARDLQRRTGLDARFVEGNVYDARALIDGDFDRVYVTWGAINWLPDMAAWARVVAALLKPGGRLYLLEGHPALLTLDEYSEKLSPAYDWRTPPDRPIVMAEDTSYTGDEDRIAHPETHEWIHPLSTIITAVIEAGLKLDWLHEHEQLAWQFSPLMVKVEEGLRRPLWRLPDGFPRLPLAFSLAATRTG
jgi:SAM-dependent methyltransferase